MLSGEMLRRCLRPGGAELLATGKMKERALEILRTRGQSLGKTPGREGGTLKGGGILGDVAVK